MKKDYVEKLRKAQIEILDEIVRICKKNNIKYFLNYGTLIGAIRHQGYIPWDDDIDIGMTRVDYDKFTIMASKELSDRFELCNYKNEVNHLQNFMKIRLKNTMMVEAYNEDKIKDQGIWVDIFPYDNLKKPNSFSMKLRKKLFDYITTMISIKIDVDYYKNSKVKKTILKIVSWLFSINQLYKIRNYICTIDNKEKTSYICSFDDDFKLCCNGFEYNKFFPVKMSKFEDKKYAIPKEYDYILKMQYGDYMKIPPKEQQITHNPQILKFEDGTVYDFRANGEKNETTKNTI